MINNIGFRHIGEIIEFLRGKTIIESVTLVRETDEEEAERLDFSFLDYVTWSYGKNIIDSIENENTFSRIEIIARQLFGENGKNFTIGFRPQSVYFDGASNIEDTLLLDLKRYLESNEIPYEVNINGTD